MRRRESSIKSQNFRVARWKSRSFPCNLDRTPKCCELLRRWLFGLRLLLRWLFAVQLLLLQSALAFPRLQVCFFFVLKSLVLCESLLGFCRAMHTAKHGAQLVPSLANNLRFRIAFDRTFEVLDSQFVISEDHFGPAEIVVGVAKSRLVLER